MGVIIALPTLQVLLSHEFQPVFAKPQTAKIPDLVLSKSLVPNVTPW